MSDARKTMRRVLSHVVEEMRAIRQGTTPPYVGDLRRRRVPSLVVEKMQAMRLLMYTTGKGGE